MYGKIILSTLVTAILCACAVKKTNNDDAVAIENSQCLNYPEPLQFLPKAEEGDVEAMKTARHYYDTCGRENISLKKTIYWTKKIADMGEFQYVGYMSSHSYVQIDPTNVDRDKSLIFDPLLYWTWQKKMCAHKEAREQLDDFLEQCTHLRPHWYTPAQWKKIITSPPTVKDKEWYQFLPKGCEQGECLPK